MDEELDCCSSILRDKPIQSAWLIPDLTKEKKNVIDLEAYKNQEASSQILNREPLIGQRQICDLTEAEATSDSRPLATQ